jgi:hypothetical protein
MSFLNAGSVISTRYSDLGAFSDAPITTKDESESLLIALC